MQHEPSGRRSSFGIAVRCVSMTNIPTASVHQVQGMHLTTMQEEHVQGVGLFLPLLAHRIQLIFPARRFSRDDNRVAQYTQQLNQIINYDNVEANFSKFTFVQIEASHQFRVRRTRSNCKTNTHASRRSARKKYHPSVSLVH